MEHTWLIIFAVKIQNMCDIDLRLLRFMNYACPLRLHQPVCPHILLQINIEMDNEE